MIKAKELVMITDKNILTLLVLGLFSNNCTTLGGVQKPITHFFNRMGILILREVHTPKLNYLI